MSLTYSLYKDTIINNLMKKLNYSNKMEVPKLNKVVVSSGLGKDCDKKIFEELKKMISIITGQVPAIRKAKKSISNFKLRKGMPVGLIVTLRRGMMYDFVDKLVYIVLSQFRDFKGISRSGFDGNGNYNLGISDMSVFPELDLNIVKQNIGLNIAFVTSANIDSDAYELLEMIGFKFRSK